MQQKFLIGCAIILSVLCVLSAFQIALLHDEVAEAKKQQQDLERRLQIAQGTIAMTNAMLDDSEAIASQLMEQIDTRRKEYESYTRTLEGILAHDPAWFNAELPGDVQCLCDTIAGRTASRGGADVSPNTM